MNLNQIDKHLLDKIDGIMWNRAKSAIFMYTTNISFRALNELGLIQTPTLLSV